MGLDIVELVMAVEDEFEIVVDDSFGDLRTVGDFHGAICTALNSATQNREAGCPSFPPFFATRDALVATAFIDEREIRPSKLLSELIPRRQRRRVWDQLAQQTGIRLPRLQLSNDVFLTVLCAVGLAIVGVPGLLAIRLGGQSFPLIMLTCCVAVILTAWACRPFAVAFPDGCRTVGDIVRRARMPRYPSQRTERMNDPETVWSKLVAIVSEQLDVPVQDITRDLRFVEDLKCG